MRVTPTYQIPVITSTALARVGLTAFQQGSGRKLTGSLPQAA